MQPTPIRLLEVFPIVSAVPLDGISGGDDGGYRLVAALLRDDPEGGGGCRIRGIGGRWAACSRRRHLFQLEQQANAHEFEEPLVRGGVARTY